MAFSFSVYINHSEKNRIDKDIERIGSVFTGTLKQGTSIIDPVIIVETNNGVRGLAKGNYLYCGMFYRYYFITDIVAVSATLTEIHCHVDVLASFAGDIRENTAIVKRQEKQWNLYLNDGSLKVYQNPLVLTKAFPSGFTTQEFVLAVAGSGN